MPPQQNFVCHTGIYDLSPLLLPVSGLNNRALKYLVKWDFVDLWLFSWSFILGPYIKLKLIFSPH